MVSPLPSSSGSSTGSEISQKLQADSDESFELVARLRLDSAATTVSMDSGIQSPKGSDDTPENLLAELESSGLGACTKHSCVDPISCAKCLQVNLSQSLKFLRTPPGEPDSCSDDCDNIADDYESRRSRMRKTSSLKSVKASPSTSHKKAVRFADTIGLDLETVKHVSDLNNPPDIPESALVHLRQDCPEDTRCVFNIEPLASTPPMTRSYLKFPQRAAITPHTHDRATVELAAQFTVPFTPEARTNMVRERKVVLETLNTHGMTITGTIRVLNLHFHKKLQGGATSVWDNNNGANYRIAVVSVQRFDETAPVY